MFIIENAHSSVSHGNNETQLLELNMMLVER
jgi:hypothetical protein